MGRVHYVYKILDRPPPDPIPEILPPTELDSKDGFVHLSNGKQVPVTAGLFFAQATELWVLKISTNGMSDDSLRWPKELSGCAHLHGAQLGRHNVVASKGWVRPPGRSWGEVFADEWLE